MNYCASPYFYRRRLTREVVVGDPHRGGVIIGGRHPVMKQSMLTCDTMDTEACVKQTLDLVEAGCQLVRITAPTVKDAANLRNIVEKLRAQNCFVPICADIHFKPEAALEAARWVEKIRINPGNFVDKKKFEVREYDDATYFAEMDRIEEVFAPLVRLCKELGRAMRIGTNHGSLSDRILNRYGDTPMGMVESALEFARVARRLDFHNFCFSMKASNPKVMIECYRLLVEKLEKLGPDWNYPVHLGVTEAGEGEDGRIKSAIGIGSLLCDGIGDTIRVSLTEDSPHEIPVCTDLIAQTPELTAPLPPVAMPEWAFTTWPVDPFNYQRRVTAEVEVGFGLKCGGEHPIRVIVPRNVYQQVAPRLRPQDDVRPEGIYEDLLVWEVDPRESLQVPDDTHLVTVKDNLPLPAISAFRLLAGRLQEAGRRNPILLKDCLAPPAAALSPARVLVASATVLGSLLADGIGDAIMVRHEPGAGASLRLAYNILQAVGSRSFKTDYVACPSCGRTLFNLQTVTARIKARTEHLKGVKIAIMGCIVNGPGEMADADFGYVGGGPGKVNLYVGKKPVRFNIPEAEAVDQLVALIKEHGKWREPDAA
ncbi:(E)-4-hydroxy-3-methylbut-2-enyl-diphosphate synthase [Fontisphaera persica]|uniref:(E)-4-hydroxy-3-methylbut-2-enyl-diphosphate synthase n=1 Tax=Fontisphaera persica TaxID=2974023 RepID=UPI0024BF1149|nr:(E)-4-hydroxy-3-methylbut-2-enyl-diphosphate synthase [Fontisphaera persica]WCJ60871.1 (E)-4-hydroxy-3-methylbut-2-enyl-diphosphate synthase [Fontisphaera persica]